MDPDVTPPLEVATVGEVMGLLLAPAATTLSAADTLDVRFAGAEATVAVGLARLGHGVALSTRLGDDVMGRRIRNELRAEGVDVRGIALISSHPTGLLLRDVGAGRPVTVEYRREGSAASTMTPDDIDRRAITTARLVHVTGITAALSATCFDTVVSVMKQARAAGATVSLDPNVRRRLASADEWHRIVEALAPLADIVLTGTDDASVVTNDPARWFSDRGAGTVVVKDGARGASEVTDGQQYEQDVFTVPVADPVGAGDAFDAGWLSAWLRGLAPQERLREAAAVAACSVAVRGDVDGLPDRSTVDAVLGRGRDVDR